MDNIAIALLVVVLAVQVYVSFFKSAGPVGDDKSSALLLEDLRRQLGEANAVAERERTAKGDAQARAAAAESARNAAQQQLTEAQQANARAVDQLRADHAKAQADAEARYNKALAYLRLSF